ncbi:ANTAR domain-containing response regulator [Thioclava sp. 15-R06ZXC-3]|uniref:ANTAR domain-containing response regulator n=1 Tax=Thioclava arctica TaxID=3238301 RepID=A0ABV3TKP4_9RHOB
MKTARITQNFRGRTAIVFSSEGRSLDLLEQTMRRLGLEADIRPLQMRQSLELPDGLHREHHIVLIDGDMTLPAAWPESYGAETPCPTIGLVGIEAPSRLKALLQLGVQAFLSKPIHSGSIYSALYLAVNEFNRMDVLHRDLHDLSDRRRKRIHVIRAVTALMRQRGLSEDAAYSILRKDSMRERVSIEDHCFDLMHAQSDDDPNSRETNKRGQAR